MTWASESRSLVLEDLHVVSRESEPLQELMASRPVHGRSCWISLEAFPQSEGQYSWFALSSASETGSRAGVGQDMLPEVPSPATYISMKPVGAWSIQPRCVECW